MVGFGIAFMLAALFSAIEPAPVAASSNQDASTPTLAAMSPAPATVDERGKLVEPPAAASAAPPAIAKPKPAVTLSAKIDLTSQTVTISEHGKQIHTWKISSGTREFQTPTGTFRPQWMAKMWFSKKYDDAPMPNSVFFKDGVALHATQATHALGRPASHGCVRLAPANAETFYRLVQKHGMAQTQINVSGTPKFGPAVAKSAPPAPGETYAAAQRLRASRTATAGGYYLPTPAPTSGSWFSANPYRYPGDPSPVQRVYRYGTR